MNIFTTRDIDFQVVRPFICVLEADSSNFVMNLWWNSKILICEVYDNYPLVYKLSAQIKET